MACWPCKQNASPPGSARESTVMEKKSLRERLRDFAIRIYRHMRRSRNNPGGRGKEKKLRKAVQKEVEGVRFSLHQS